MQFDSCRNCGRSWEVTLRPTPKVACTEKDIISLVEKTGHLCHRCSERRLLITMKRDAGKEPDIEEIDRHIKKKYGY